MQLSKTTSTVDRTQTVADLVLDHSECAGVLNRHRIDFCCRGDMTIEAAAEAKGMDPETLIAELAHTIETRLGGPGKDPRGLSTALLIAHIVSTHHEYLREAIPFIRGLAAKVSRVHGDHNPKLRELDVAVHELTGALLPHLDEEENGLFPALTAGAAHDPAVTAQLDVMAQEHLEVAGLLERVRAASDNFTVPSWGCTSYRTLFAELEQLEADVHVHVHLENHVLKPRFEP